MESISYIYDILFLAVFAVAAVCSWRKGFLAGLAELAGTLFSAAAALVGSRTLAPQFYDWFVRYILGGSYWYKKPFFKTLGTLMLISILCSVLSVHIISWVGNDGMRSFAEWLEANSQWMTLNKLLSLGVAFFSAFTMFNWWLSYRLFTRSQVIKPKFRLL